MVSSVGTRSTETVDNAEVGQHYTGVDPKMLGTSDPFQYGFLFYEKFKAPEPYIDIHYVVLPLAPQNIVVDEPAAVMVTPTLNAGKFIERRGQIIKTITISGTTGFTPHPAVTNGAIRKAMPRPTLIKQEASNSGLSEFIFLRDMFRKYWEIFSLPSNAEARKKMPFIVWVNEKDDEVWVVEPISFRMTRSVPRNKFTYNYDIVMQTIAPLANVGFYKDTSSVGAKVLSAMAAVSNVMDQVNRSIAAISQGMAEINGAIQGAVGAVLGAVEQVANGVAGIIQQAGDLTDIAGVVKGQWDTMTNSFQHVWEEALICNDKYRGNDGANPIPDSVMAAMTDVAQAISTLSARPELFSTDLTGKWADQVTPFYSPSYGFGGVNPNITNPLTASSVQEVSILPKDDLIKIASRELGDGERFMELVVLNGLKPPYISPTRESRLPNTLAPGDPIIIPAHRGGSTAPGAVRTVVHIDPVHTGGVTSVVGLTSHLDADGLTWRANQWAGFTAQIISGPGAGETQIITASGTDSVTVGASWTTPPTADSVMTLKLVRSDAPPAKSVNDQILGIDLALDTTGSDLALSTGGGLQRIKGVANMKQAVTMATKTRPGDLPAQMGYGLAAQPGSKANVHALLAYKMAIRQTLLRDPRIDEVAQVQVSLERDIQRFSARVFTTGSSEPFSVSSGA